MTLMDEKFKEDQMTVKDFYGEVHGLPRLTVLVLLTASWLFYLLSLLLDVLYYKLHPSFVLLSPKNKKSVYIFGVCRQLFK